MNILVDQSTDQPLTEAEADQSPIEDHIALIYESNEERLGTVTPLIKVGLEKGELCLYISDEEEDLAVIEALKAEHIDVDKAVSNGGLILTSKKEMYFKLGRFDPEWTLRVVNNIADLARSYGFTAMRIMSDMTWTLEKVPGVERWPEYEARLNTLNPGISLRIICQYDRSAFSPEALMAAVQTHPKIVTQGSVNKNIFHIPSDQILKGSYAELELERVMGSIRQINSAEAELQERDQIIQALSRQVEQDGTVRKGLEQALDESRRRFRDLAERTSDWAWELDDQGVYVYSSPRIKDVLGLRPEDVLGRDPVDLVSKDDSERVSKQLARVISSRAPISAMEKEVRHKDGHIVYLEMSGTPYFDPEGKYLGYRGVDRDITGRKAAKQAIEESRKRTDESLAEIERRDGRISTLEAEIEHLRASLADTDEAIVAIKGDLSAKQGELAQASEVMTKLQEVLQIRDEELAAANDNIHERQARVDEHSKEIGQLKQAIGLREVELAGIGASLLAAQTLADNKSSELDHLTGVYNSQTLELKGARESLAGVEEALAHKEQELFAVRQQIERLEADLKAASETVATREQELSATKEEVTSLTASLEQTRMELTTTKEELGSKIDSLESTEAELSSTSGELAIKVAALIETTALLEHRDGELTAAKEDISSKTAKLEETETELTRTSDELSAKVSELAETSAQLDQRSADLTAANEEISSKTAKLEETETELAKVSGELSAKGAALTLTAVALEQHIAELAAVRDDLESRTQKLTNAEQELERLNGALGDKESALGETIASYEGAKADLAALSEETQQIKEAIAELERDKEGILELVSTRDTEMIGLQTRYDELAALLNIRNEELDAARSLVQSREQELDTVTSRADILSKVLTLKEEELAAALRDASAVGAEAALLRAQVTQMESDLNVGSTVNLGLREAMDNRQKALSAILAEAAASDVRAKGLEDEKNRLALDLDRADGDLYSITVSLGQSEQELAASRAEMEERERELAGVSAALEERERDLAAAKGLLGEREADLAGMRVKVEDYESQLIAATARTGETELELATTRGQLSESEERFKALFEQSGVGIVRVAPEGGVVDANSKFHEIMGYAPEELAEKRYPDLTHEDDTSEIDALHQRLVSGESSSTSVLKRLVRKSGSTVWANITMSAVKDDRNNVRYLMAVVDDRTDQILAEQSLREKEYLEREERLRRTWENSADGVWVLDPEGRTTFVNPAMAAMLGYSSEEMTGQMISGFMNDDWRKRSHDELGKEVLLVRRDGTDLWATISSLPILDQTGHVTGAVGLVNDITDIKQRVYDLEAAKDASAREAARLGHIIGGMNVPIAVVAADGTVAMANPALERMMDGEVVGKSTQEVWPGLDISEPARIKVSRDDREVEMRILPSILRDGLRETGTVLSFVEALPERPADAPSPEMLAHDLNDSLQVIMGSVSLAKEYVIPEGRMYSKLKQIESASVTARDLAGRLMTSAREGHPLTDVPETATTLVRGKGRLLLMDDDENVLEATGDLLRYLGYDIEVARDGEEAMVLAKEAEEIYRPFDLALLDLSISSGTGGLEAGQMLKAADPQIHLVVTSGYVSDPVIADPGAYGFSAALPKPYSAELLSCTIAEVLGLRSPESKNL
jgi:PAS domain S-box-containing protein